MKMKLTNKIKNIIVILLIGVLLFVILGAFNYTYQEGYKHSSDKDSSDNDVPTCSDSLENDEEQNMYDNWFLKTKMVPPICPTCPYYFPLDKKEDKKDDEKKDNEEDEDINDNSGNQNDNSINQKLINNSDNSINQNVNQQQSADNKWNNLFGNNSITFGGNKTTTQPNYNTSQIGTLAGSGPAPVNNNSPVSTPAQAGSNDSCPPCPACERCPEPAFECKKVPNYRSASMDNYMPLPVLNDFSRF